MTTSYYNILLTPDSDRARRLRSIENYYQLQMIGADTASLAEYQRQQYKDQARLALASRGNFPNSSYQLNEITSVLRSLEGSVVDGFDSVIGAIEDGFDQIVCEIQAQNRRLDEIITILKQPARTRCNELIQLAIERLELAMATGADKEMFRRKDYEDAHRLLLQVTEDEVGKMMPFAWFNLGWLEWKYRNNAKMALKYFEEAVRLDRGDSSSNYHNSLLHLAYLQLLEGKTAESKGTIAEARRVKSDYQATYITALVHSRLTQESKSRSDRSAAIAWISQCLRRWPESISAILAEAEFRHLRPEIEQLIKNLSYQWRQTLWQSLSTWEDYQSRLYAAGQELHLPVQDRAWVDEHNNIRTWSHQAGYLWLVRAAPVASERLIKRYKAFGQDLIAREIDRRLANHPYRRLMKIFGL